MSRKRWRESIAQSYRWAIAGAVGAIFGNLKLPGPGAFLQEPVVGVVIMGYLVFFLALIVAIGASLDQLVSHVIAPSDGK